MRHTPMPRQQIMVATKAIDTNTAILKIIAFFMALAMTAFWMPGKAFSADSDNMKVAKAFSGALAEVVEQVSPSVVGIETERMVKSENFSGDDSMDIFERFFEQMPRGFGPSPRRSPNQMEPRRSRGLGSGSIISAEGHILTNNHVVADADTIKVELPFEKGKTFKAEIVGTDPNTDIAVIKLIDPPANLPVASLGDSELMKPGNLVVAIGSPLGFKQSVTFGIVSAKGRTLGEFSYERFIQTDASINMGNSGGPLLNLDGEIIGINTMISTGGGSGSIGIGFAIPMSQAKNVVEQLIATGTVTRGWVGIVMNPDDQDISRELGHDGSGVLVTDTDPKGPAARAGIEKGDLIIAFDDQPIRDNEHLRYMVAEMQPGKDVAATVLRNGKKVTLTIRIEAQPEDMFARSRAIGSQGQSNGRNQGEEETNADMGITLQNLNDQTRQRYNIADSVTSGVIVTKVEAGSEAEDQGLIVGTVILELDREQVKDIATFQTLLKDKKAEGKDRVLAYVRHGDIARYVMLRLK